MLTILLVLFFCQNECLLDEDNYPDPTQNGFQACGLSQKSYLCDPDLVLSVKERNDLSKMLNDFPNQTIDVRIIIFYY